MDEFREEQRSGAVAYGTGPTVLIVIGNSWNAPLIPIKKGDTLSVILHEPKTAPTFWRGPTIASNPSPTARCQGGGISISDEDEPSVQMTVLAAPTFSLAAPSEDRRERET
jgi:hypothetical protein